MKQCKQCQNEFESSRSDAVYCSAKCRVTANRNKTGDVTANHTVEQCKRRAAAGKPWRKGDPAWPYTRHLTPIAFVAWCRLNKPSWLTSAKPGDEDYNWDESALQADYAARTRPGLRTPCEETVPDVVGMGG